MELDELKMIWDDQNKQPLFALDTSALQALVRRRNTEFNRCAACRYKAEITIGVVCGLAMAGAAGVLAFGRQEWLVRATWVRAAVTPWDVVALAVSSAIWFYYAGYMNLARRRQQRCGEEFESSLRGDLDRALARVEYQIEIAKGIVWWGTVPVWIAVALWIGVLFRLIVSPPWAYVLIGATMLGAFVTTNRCKRTKIQDHYEPHQRELKALRTKLTDPLF